SSPGAPALGVIGEPWYNPYGDCIHFQAEECAYFGERIDEFLTIFRHHEDRRPIGFRIKGVRALLDKLPIEGIKVDAEVAEKTLKRVSLSLLLLIAYKQSSQNSARTLGYAEAIKTRHEDEILVAS
ncbi:MAG: hypothetical protein HYZ00_14500, partial [Candidatus Hydrogenedentes bacterium]|nr:hypothetical protein [Candidatus Hydrogenedentota bacterium]